MEINSSPVGVFDSGMGGLSVLLDAVRMLPNERFIYYGDTKNAPYGEKTEAEVCALSLKVTETLLSRGAKALLIACNTATCSAAETLRARFSMPVIGMEPALKTGAMARKSGSILVMATPVTLRSQKYARLYATYGENAISLPCPGLMEFVENGDLTSERLHAHLAALLSPYLSKQIDAVVLGCTHYVFIRDIIASFFPPDTRVLDGNEGTVRQLERRLTQANLRANALAPGGYELLSSGGEEAIQRMRELLGVAQPFTRP